MQSFDFSVNEPYSFNGSSFLPLGTATGLPQIPNEELLKSKLAYDTDSKLDEVWGTLGWEDGSPFNPAGVIHFSGEGNLDEGSENILTQREISDIKSFNPAIKGKPGEVRERFINFDDLHFELPASFNPIDIPRLRLTLFLAPDEGAIVYYQHSEKGNMNDPEALFEYILCERTDSDFSTNRDRLHYYFPVEPKHKLEALDEDANIYRESGEPTGLSFIVKVLTFKRANKTADELFKEAKDTLNSDPGVDEDNILYNLVGKEKYNLYVFDKDNDHIASEEENGKKISHHFGGRFVPVDHAGQINTQLKTLLLIHGTFVNTLKSFKDLILKRGPAHDEPSYLQYILENGKFEQVLAFDHPTISHDASQNVAWLISKFRTLGISFEQNPLHVITTSRGALVAEYLASYPEANDLLPLKKVMMFSAANGCGYFTTGKTISKVLTIWRNMASGPAAKVILSLIQFSVDYFLRQPGCIMMRPGSDPLNYILTRQPNNSTLTYKCVVSDWDKCLVADLGPLKRIGNTALDALIKVSLGKKHDWVIGCDSQEKVPQPSEAHREVSEYRHAVHGRYLEPGYVNDTNCTHIADPHYSITAFFSA